MKYSEKWGDSIEQAVELALSDLKLTREEVTVTVLEEPSKGFFGIGSKLAKVRVEKIETKDESISEDVKSGRREMRDSAIKEIKKEGDKEICIEVCGVEEGGYEEYKRQDSRSVGRRTKSAKKRRTPKRNADTSSTAVFSEEDSKEKGEGILFISERPDDLVEVADHPVKGFIESIIREMGLNLSLSIHINSQNVYVDIEGPDTGTIIGKRGQTLDAVQYLAGLVVNRNSNEYVRVILNAEGYRQKRAKTLERLAIRMADKAIRSGREVKLEPMNPYERKIIHSTLHSRKDVRTRSEGEEPYRRVVIESQR